MKNISDTDGLGRKERLERFLHPVSVPVLEERFPVLLARVLSGTEFSSLYRYQPLSVWLEIERFDSATDARNIYRSLLDWRKRLEYASLEGGDSQLLKDLRGQIEKNIRPMLTAIREKKQVGDFQHRFQLLLQDTVRLLQARKNVYWDELNVSGRMDPSLAVLVAFLHNYQHIVSTFNLRWQHLPLFYLREILKVAPLPERKTTTWLSFDKLPGVRLDIPAGTCLATEERNGYGYKLLTDIYVSDMKVSEVRKVRVERNPERYPAATLGYVTSVVQHSLKEESGIDVPIGIEICSRLLWLSGGEREVYVSFRLLPGSQDLLEKMIREVARSQEISIDESVFKILNDSFLLEVSTAEGYRQIDNFHLRKCDEGLRLTFYLADDFPAIVSVGEGKVPSIRLLMNREAWLFPYSWARDMWIRSVRMRVRVNGLCDLDVYNELGHIDIRQPFSPFGVNGNIGTWMAFGSKEITGKPVSHVELAFRWLYLPKGNGGLRIYYQGYETDIDNRSFRCYIEALRNKKWKPVQEKQKQYLFRTSADPVPECGGMLKGETSFAFDVSEAAEYYRIVLSDPLMGFGREEFRRLFADVMMYNSRHSRKPRLIPNEPLSPFIDGISMNYEAEEECLFTVGQTTDMCFAYIRPLSDTVDMLAEKAHPIALADGPEDELNLMIGIKNVVGENLISLYLETESLQREIDHRFLPVTDWYYRNSIRWMKVPPVGLLLDNTSGLMHSGAVVIQLPFAVTEDMTDAEGIFWLCVAVCANACNCSLVRSVHLNIAEVELIKGEFSDVNVQGLQSYSRVGVVESGIGEESEVEMQVRLSERISHRKRALLPGEYEQMTLQEFPEISKVKCLPGVNTKSSGKALGVSLVVVANRQNNEWPLCTDELLCKVENYLRPFVSPFVEIDAINPVYEEVTVFCGVKLKAGQSAGRVISEVDGNIRKCIAPWSSGEGIPVFGYHFSIRDMVSCIKECTGIEELGGLKMIQVMNDEKRHFVLKEYIMEQEEEQEVIPSTPWAVLIPAVKQYVKLVTADQWRREVELGDLEIGSTFVIE